MPLFSLITPSKGRELGLIMRYQQLLSQTCSDWEWRILDSSDYPSPYFLELKDPRVYYRHTEEYFSLGEKRNWLKSAAQGKWVVHCDDDDFFSREYLNFLVDQFPTGDFFKASSWFSHDKEGNQLYYVDAAESFSSYYHFDPITETQVREVKMGRVIEKSAGNSLQKKKSQGYGFSFVYHREKTLKLLFPSIDVGEDLTFYESVQNAGLKQKSYEEKKGLIVKGLNHRNLSNHYAQYRIPSFFIETLLPHYNAYLKGEMR
jgi:glycosyltransferase involved in cell wall biosynthesis